MERLLAVQAQDWQGMLLAVRARNAHLTAAAVIRALSQDRTLLITWLNRGTLHLVRSEDYPWLLSLTAGRPGAGGLIRLAQVGVSSEAAERAVAVIERSLAEEGPLTRAQLGERLAVRDLPWQGQALLHILYLASRRGLIVRGPGIGRSQAFVVVRDWLEPTPLVAREVALAELARRYLTGHAPASDRDFAQWAGVPLEDAREGLRGLGSLLSERAEGLLELRQRGRPAPLPKPLLLGLFDPLLMGWQSREPVLGEDQGVITVNGLFRPVALVQGQAVGTWRFTSGRVTLQPFAPLEGGVVAALADAARDIARFLGVPQRQMAA